MDPLPSPDVALVQVDQLTKRFVQRSAPVLDGVSVVVRPNERIALLGSNGAGKSTLFRCLLGLIPFDTGRVTLFGNDLRTTSIRLQNKLRSQVGFVPQQHGLSPRLSVLSNVIHGRLGQGRSWRRFVQWAASEIERQQALELLKQLGLANKAMQPCGLLSGGESQRVALARALFNKPRLFIADEPAASLDPHIAKEIMGTLYQQSIETQASLLFATHILEHAQQFGDRLVALGHGQILLDCRSDAVTISQLQKIYV